MQPCYSAFGTRALGSSCSLGPATGRTDFSGLSRKAAYRAAAPRRLSAWGHLSLLFGLLLRKLLGGQGKRRRPRPRRLAWNFRRDLHISGLAVARLPQDALEGLRRAACEAIADRSSCSADSDSHGSRFRLAGGLNGAFPSSMSWRWAADAEGLRAFRPAAEVLLRQLGPKFHLVGASFVVAEIGAGCEEAASRFHLDFGPPRIPRQAAATALLPLHPPGAFPEREGNLEYRPWDGNDEVAMHRYNACEAAVFDGKLAHRTQPFRPEAFFQDVVGGTGSRESQEASPLHGFRVLASLSFARLPGPWAEDVAQVMAGYGAPVLPPLALPGKT
eukprot:TRINITY_DN35426_c0_g1_i1.p1 TRINITY_DN35426_c0_g1~~TRINITY_DN35426_c0_g1_i1.p1  ORF type:complete len:343 (-),score=52.06 TRINITY_DN35426_c0_g1_i1:339-1331(-)